MSRRIGQSELSCPCCAPDKRVMKQYFMDLKSRRRDDVNVGGRVAQLSISPLQFFGWGQSGGGSPVNPLH